MKTNEKKLEIKNFIVEKIIEKYKELGIDFSKDKITEEFSLTDSGIFDSMEFLTFVSELEDTFSIEIDFSKQDPSQMTTIISVLNSVREC